MMSLNEHFPFECVSSDINYTTIDLWEGQSFHLIDSSLAPSDNINYQLDLFLVRFIGQNRFNLPVGEDVKVLVLNCGQGLAGIMTLKLLCCRDVTFVDSSEAMITQCTWANIAMNATMEMGGVRCLSVTGGSGQSVLADKVNADNVGISSSAEALLPWEEAGVLYDLVLVLEPEPTPTRWLQLRDVLQKRLLPGGVALVACQSKSILPAPATAAGSGAAGSDRSVPPTVEAVAVPVPWESAAAADQGQGEGEEHRWTAERTVGLQTTLLTGVQAGDLAVLRLVHVGGENGSSE